MSTYLFIDGGYARKIYRRAMEDVFDKAGELQPELIARQINSQRTFFYDCLDDSPREKEAADVFAARVKKQTDYFERIKSSRGIHLRLGKLTGGANKRQKEVDVLLAVDM